MPLPTASPPRPLASIAVLGSSLLLAAACETSPAEREPPPNEAPDGPDESAPQLEWLAHDDGSVEGTVEYAEPPDASYEYTRFRPEAPARLHRLRVRLEIPRAAEVTARVWDTFGGGPIVVEDGEHRGEDGPLASTTRRVDPDEDGEWITLEFDDPPVVDPVRHVFAGLVVDGRHSPRLRHDSEQPGFRDGPPRSFVWRSSKPRKPSDGPPISPAPSDFALRLGLERLADPDSRRIFQAEPLREIGLASFRRVALADVDDDGDLDVMLDGPRLFLNDGDGHFEEVTDAWIPDGIASNGGVFGDFDNDGDPDYFAAGDDDHLLAHRGDRYVDVTGESGIDDTRRLDCGDDSPNKRHAPTEGAAWVDIDNDGWLDLYQANYHCQGDPHANAADRLWLNRGDGTFRRAELPVGTDQTTPAAQSGRGVAPADADDDGTPEVLVTNYRLDPNFLLDRRDGQLVDLGPSSGLAGEKSRHDDRTYFGHSIGAAWGDVDRDGTLDVFVANLAHPRDLEVSQTARLYLDASDDDDDEGLRFADATERAGFRYRETASNPTLWDFDNDGDLDLFYTCVYPNTYSAFYRNDDHPDWEEVSFETGVQVENGWGSAVGDLDGDGDLDLLAGDRVFFNRNPSRRGAVFVRAVGGGDGRTNRDGIGARVTATIDGKPVLRERYGAHGTTVQDSPWMHVGLGEADAADLDVEFPATGEVVSVPDARAGERIVVREDGTVRRE